MLLSLESVLITTTTAVFYSIALKSILSYHFEYFPLSNQVIKPNTLLLSGNSLLINTFTNIQTAL